MSADSENIRASLTEQLTDLDAGLGATADDVDMLADMQQGLSRLLHDNRIAESEIRKVLQDQYEAGKLRKETYQLVKSMLDHYDGKPPASRPVAAAVAAPTAPPAPTAPAADAGEDVFSSTTVLPNEVLRQPTADDQVQVGSILRDRFLLQERVAGGSMGVVYKALDRRLAEAGAESPYVAIKVLSPQLSRSGPALRALQQEAAKGRCLLHPNIVRFIDLDREDELYFLVMEWMEGRTLADILDSPDGKKIGLDRALEIVRQVGAALDYAHKCGIVHADVKPGNVMVQSDGSVKLFDFGIARVLQTQATNKDFDPRELGALTPAYSSMQVLTGDEPVPADDVFSLGCLMYRLIAGYRVFGPRNAAEASQEGMQPQRINALSDSQWRALSKAISYSRVTRFETMAEFLAALNDRSEETISLDPDERRFVEQPSGGGMGWLIALIVLLGILGFAGYRFDLHETALQWLESLQAGDDTRVLDVAAPPSVEIATPQDAVVTEQTPAEAPLTDTVADIAADAEIAEDSVAPLAEEAATDVAAEPADDPVTVVDEAATADATTESTLDAVAVEMPAIPDYSNLPAADFEVYLIDTEAAIEPLNLTLREGRRGVVVDLVRDVGVDEPLSLRVEEIGHSGNRSPWASGQIVISNEGFIDFLPGQRRARLSLDMVDDPLREADQQSTLRIRELDSATGEYALMEVTLEDDDQRVFESQLPANTIAFAVSQVAVAERDPAVQLDILRFNPDDQTIVVGFVVKEVTATAGEDYFPPGSNTLTFAPGQRTARLLIPLVQDSFSEGDEAFTVELSTGDSAVDSDVFQRIIVMIRDDDR